MLRGISYSIKNISWHSIGVSQKTFFLFSENLSKLLRSCLHLRIISGTGLSIRALGGYTTFFFEELEGRQCGVND